MHNQRLKASITLMIGGAFWGLLWIPLRAIEGVGVEKAWATLVQKAEMQGAKSSMQA